MRGKATGLPNAAAGEQPGPADTFGALEDIDYLPAYLNGLL